jgi:nickel/cobalt exporter
LVPCPEAMVVLLMAVSLHRLGLGLVLLVAFSIGLAVVLIVIGVAMILSGSLLSRVSSTGWLTSKVLPVGSAAVVTLLGAGIVYQAARSLTP